MHQINLARPIPFTNAEHYRHITMITAKVVVHSAVEMKNIMFIIRWAFNHSVGMVTDAPQ
jgi:hypothetical protein